LENPGADAYILSKNASIGQIFVKIEASAHTTPPITKIP